MFTYEPDSVYYTITGFIGEVPNELEIPSKIDGVNVRSIAANAFEHCSNLVSVKLPYCVRKIGHRAFADCRNLRSINLDEVEHLYTDSFSGTKVVVKMVIV